jgi:hypothetical protein
MGKLPLIPANRAVRVCNYSKATLLFSRYNTSIIHNRILVKSHREESNPSKVVYKTTASPLCYDGVWQGRDLNPQHTGYEPVKLPLLYPAIHNYNT